MKKVLINTDDVSRQLDVSKKAIKDLEEREILALRKVRLLEKDVKILRTMLGVCREEGRVGLGSLYEDDVAVLMTPVDSLNLSARTKRLLAKGRVSYVGDLVYCGEKRLLAITGFGTTSLQEVKEVVVKLNLPMGSRMPAWDYIRKACAKEEPFVYEELFELDAETNDYVATVLEGLPEDRVGEIWDLFLGLFAIGERYKANYVRYKQINLALREDIARLEKALKNDDYYLSPAYEEVKKLFAKVEYTNARKKDEKAKDAKPVEPAQTALGLVDCIFNQEAFQAESRWMKDNRQTIANLEKKVKKLEQQLAEKEALVKEKTEKVEKVRVEVAKKAEEDYQVKIKVLKKELGNERRRNAGLERRLLYATEMKETVEQVKTEREEVIELVRHQENYIKQLEFDKKTRDLTIDVLNKQLREGDSGRRLLAEIERRRKAEENEAVLKGQLEECRKKLSESETQSDNNRFEVAAKLSRVSSLELEMSRLKSEHRCEIHNLWGALISYESQVNSFNSSFFLEKMWTKLEKYSNSKTKKVTKCMFKPLREGKEEEQDEGSSS